MVALAKDGSLHAMGARVLTTVVRSSSGAGALRRPRGGTRASSRTASAGATAEMGTIELAQP